MSGTDRAMDDQTHEFDLLADGELSEAQRRELLGRLDEQPEGWRRCALAFLEAQDWRRELPRTAREPASTAAEDSADGSECAAEGNAAPPTVVVRRPALGWFGTMLAMAASFALALGMGVVWRGGWRGEPGGAPHRAMRPDSHDAVSSNPPTASGDVPMVETRPAPSPRYGTVKLAVTGANGEPQFIEVPVLAVDRYDPALIGRQPAGLPEDLVKQLRRSGHEVNQYRELVPVSLDDGRQLVLPVDQVEVRFVNQGYQ